ncbi:MAG: HAD-IA family hydrolase [Rhodobacteraceae bacterium]|nr:HAD-IA family hydrolase [Paracoccaceae bacterium]
MTGLKLAIFDVDGTLIDSQGHINAAMAEAFAALGLEPPGRAEIRAVVGLSLPNAIATLAPDFDEPTLAKAVAAYKDAFAALADLQGAAASPLYPGTVEMLDVLARHERLLLGIATGKSRRGLDRVLDLHGLTSRFVTTQVADDHPSKPHPAMVLAALDAAGCGPGDAVMIGDTGFDMAMAQAADVATIAVSWGYHPVDRLVAAAPDMVVHDMAALAGAVTQMLRLDDA